MAKPPQQMLFGTFVLRFWREQSALSPRWRGLVEHVQTGEGAAFDDVRQMLAFIGGFVPALESQTAGSAAVEEAASKAGPTSGEGLNASVSRRKL